MIDELFHGRMFYHKFEEILAHKGTTQCKLCLDNYSFHDGKYGQVGEVIKKMVSKNIQQRISLPRAEELIAGLSQAILN